MATILVATGAGCRVFTDSGEGETELPGRPVNALAPEPGGACLAVVDGNQIWRRSAGGEWSEVATADVALGSILSVRGTVYAGAMAEAVMVRVVPGGQGKRLDGFDRVPGRDKWFANGPPLHVRSLAATTDGAVILAAVHVGGIPRSSDGGGTWTPTIPIAFDVHEIKSHPTLPNVVVAAASAGLCVSDDAGRTWKVIAEGLEKTTLLAVATLEDEALFSVQDGPFAERSQIWRWRFAGGRPEPVREGLPEWLEGKADTAQIAAAAGRAAVIDRGGNLWFSRKASSGWEQIASGLPYVFGVAIV